MRKELFNMKKICKYCGQVFETKSKKSISCNSPDCKKEHKRELDTKDRKLQCKICGKYFIGKKGNKYCSKECKSIGIKEKHKTEIKKCSICGKNFESFRGTEHCKECEIESKRIYNKECQYCGKIYKAFSNDSKFCSIKCTTDYQRDIASEKRIKKCKEIVELDGTKKIINIEKTNNKDRGDILTIKCLKCGNEENISTRIVYAGKYIGCKKCYEKHCRKCGSVITGYRKDDICTTCKTEIKKEEKREKIRKKIEEKEMQRKQAIERINKEKSKLKKCTSCGKEFTNSLLEICNECNEILEKRLHGIRCECCGELFVPKHHNKKYCSERCARKSSNKRKDILRDKRLKENGEIDNSITLEKLYKRDDGVCKICGKKCDYNDYRKDENNSFIAGNDYPSIDHIIPISKGGQHTWDNVQLAHMICNSIKNNKI